MAIGWLTVMVVAFGVVATTIGMLCDRRTRPIGLILLTLPVAILLFLAVVLITQPSENTPVEADAASAAMQHEQSVSAADGAASNEEPVEVLVRATESKLEIMPKPGTTVDAILKAVGKAIAETQRSRPFAGRERNDRAAAAPVDAAVDSELREAATLHVAETNRPEWVDEPPGRGPNGRYQRSLTLGPFTTREECEAALPAALELAATEYTAKYLGEQAAARIDLSVEQLRQQLVAETWEETIQASVGPMVQLHILLRFDSAFNGLLKQHWHRAQVQERIAGIGALMFLVLSLLFVAFAYLKIDLATAGAYRGRLKLAAAAVILTLTAGTWLLAIS